MILDKLDELLNFPVFNINIGCFKEGAQEVKAFEDAVSLLDIKSVSFECSHEEFNAETAKFEKATRLSQLSPVARNDVSRSVWKKFTEYKKQYELLDSTFKGRKNKKEALILKINMLDFFAELGRGLPTYSEIQDRFNIIGSIEKTIGELNAKSEFLPADTVKKLNAIKDNCNKCFAPWSRSFSGNGEIKSDNDIYYCGEIKNGRANGKGELYYLDILYERDNYYGDVVNGNCQGNGVLVYRNGDVYEGSFNDNYPEGKGKITYKNGDIYEGEFRKGKRHGYGKLTGSEQYEGHWRDDQRAPTAEENAYWKGIEVYDSVKGVSFSESKWDEEREKYQQALNYFNKANGFLNSAEFIAKCETAIKGIKIKVRKAESRIRRKSQSVYLIQIISIAIALAAEFLLAMWLGNIGHIWYTMWTTFAISGLYFAISNRVHENHMAWTVISTMLVVAMDITAVCLYSSFYWGTVFLVIFNSAITVTLSVLFKYFEDLPGLVCSLKVIPLMILFGLTLGCFILSGFLMKHFYVTSNMWHALWIAPVILTGYSVSFALLAKWIGVRSFDYDGVYCGSYLGLFALTIFLRVAIVVGSFGFGVGIFFFCVLLFVIQAVSCAGNILSFLNINGIID